MLSDAHITQIRERATLLIESERKHGSPAIAQTLSDLLALVDQLRQERDAARERVQWFEKSGGVAAHTRVFQEMNRAEAAEAACARLRTALETIRDGETSSGIAPVGGCMCRHDDENCCNKVGEFCVWCIADAALALPDDGAESLTHRKRRKI